MTGRIERFDSGNKVRVLGSSEIPAGTPTVLDSKTKQEGMTPVEVVHHEETVIEGQDKIRRRKDGEIDLRYREAKSRAEWERIKRGEDG